MTTSNHWGGLFRMENKVEIPAAHPTAGATGATGVRRIVSGDVPHDPAENVTYVVVSSRDKQVVASFLLPGRANIPKFSIVVTVPSATETYQAGRLDEHGKFIPANFKISETSPVSTDTMNAGGTRHGA
jgi:hypothetical protein